MILLVSSRTESSVEPRFVEQDLRGARFVRCDLADVVMRGVDLTGADIDAGFEGSLIVNGVNVAPLIEAELNQRFPGRELRRADDPDGLRAAWEAVRAAWVRPWRGPKRCRPEPSMCLSTANGPSPRHCGTW